MHPGKPLAAKCLSMAVLALFLIGCASGPPGQKTEAEMKAITDRTIQAERLILKKQFAQAVPIVESLMAEDPLDPQKGPTYEQRRLFYLHSQCMEDAGRLDEAIADEQQCLRYDNYSPTSYHKGHLEVLTRRKLGLELERTTAALKASPDSPQAIRDHAIACANRPADETSSSDAGLADLQHLAQLTPLTAADQNLRAQFSWRKQLIPAAMEHSATAISLDPHCGWQPYYYLARGAESVGQLDKSADLFDRAISQANADPRAGELYAAVTQFRLAAYDRVNDPERLATAVKACEAWTKAFPGELRAWLRLGHLRLLQRQYDEAAAVATQAEKIDEKSPDPKYLLATIYYEQWKAAPQEGHTWWAVKKYQQAWELGEGEKMTRGSFSNQADSPGAWTTAHISGLSHMAEILNAYPHQSFINTGFTETGNANAREAIDLAKLVRKVAPSLAIDVRASTSVEEYSERMDREHDQVMRENRQASARWAERERAERIKLQSERVQELSEAADRQRQFGPDPYTTSVNGTLWKMVDENEKAGAALSQNMRDEARANQFRHDLDRAFGSK